MVFIRNLLEHSRRQHGMKSGLRVIRNVYVPPDRTTLEWVLLSIPHDPTVKVTATSSIVRCSCGAPEVESWEGVIDVKLELEEFDFVVKDAYSRTQDSEIIYEFLCNGNIDLGVHDSTFGDEFLGCRRHHG